MANLCLAWALWPKYRCLLAPAYTRRFIMAKIQLIPARDNGQTDVDASAWPKRTMRVRGPVLWPICSGQKQPAMAKLAQVWPNFSPDGQSL